MSTVSSPRKECSWDAEKGIHNDNIHYRDKLYQFRALVSKESSSAALPVSLISSAALHCHPSSGLISPIYISEQWTEACFKKRRASQRALLQSHVQTLHRRADGIVSDGFRSSLDIPSGKTRSQRMKIHQRQLWSRFNWQKHTMRLSALEGNLKGNLV